MVSNLLPFRTSYGHFTEILPDEIDSTTKQKIEHMKSDLEKALVDDINFIKSLMRVPLQINFDNFQKPDLLIRKTFLRRNEKLKRNSEKINFGLANLFMRKEIFSILAGEMIEIIDIVKRLYEEYLRLPMSDRQKRVAFIFFTRKYQELIGYAVNICDLIEEYVPLFDYTCNMLNSSYKIEHSIKFAHVYDYELLAGAEELLLRGNTGRFTSPPLIRSALEIIITRTILDTENSIRHKGKQIMILPTFEFKDILNTVQSLGHEISIGTDSVRRIYEWGSISSHKAYRMSHSQMWYALFFVRLVRQGILRIKNSTSVENAIDDILDSLHANEKICIS